MLFIKKLEKYKEIYCAKYYHSFNPGTKIIDIVIFLEKKTMRKGGREERKELLKSRISNESGRHD